MMLGSYYYKSKAKEYLKGNWQNAMLVAFFSGVLGTVLQVLQLVLLPNQLGFATAEAYLEALLQIPQSTWIILLAGSLATLLFSPVLGLGNNHYFVELTRGTDLGFTGLFSRMSLFGKALWLYLRMAVQILLWSLLLVIPGIIAAIRYSMAPYYLAENPEITAGEALERSKAAMDGRKMTFFSLVISFMGWTLLALLVETYLGDVNYVLGTVVGLAIQVWVAAYQNAAIAAFYRVVSEKNGMRRAFDEMFGHFEEMGMDPETLEQMKEQAEQSMQQPDREAGEGNSDRPSDDDEMLD
ncbi:MAG: DUF975 family protein [Clostridia bacterium]|nr:DUF975 family protein [Clostridia bacterium]